MLLFSTRRNHCLGGDWVKALPLVASGVFLAATATHAEPVQTATQGQFAVALAEKLGHKATAEDSGGAVALLSNLNIVPGLGPHAVWNPDEPATTKFVADIQAAIQMLLKGVALDVGVPPPPTLDLFVFELPPAPQKIVFPAQDNSDRSPAGAGAPNRQDTGPVDAPTQVGMPRAPTTPPPPPISNPTELTPAVGPGPAGDATGPQ
jgi:hypothetical protein